MSVVYASLNLHSAWKGSLGPGAADARPKRRGRRKAWGRRGRRKHRKKLVMYLTLILMKCFNFIKILSLKIFLFSKVVT